MKATTPQRDTRASPNGLGVTGIGSLVNRVALSHDATLDLSHGATPPQTTPPSTTAQYPPQRSPSRHAGTSRPPPPRHSPRGTAGRRHSRPPCSTHHPPSRHRVPDSPRWSGSGAVPLPPTPTPSRCTATHTAAAAPPPRPDPHPGHAITWPKQLPFPGTNPPQGRRRSAAEWRR